MERNTMRIGIFADSHYSSQEVTCRNRYNSRSLDKIKQAYRYFEEENCELVICLGDLIDKEDAHEKEIHNLMEIAKVIRESPLNSVCLMGNHDAFAFEQREFYEILGIAKPETVKAGNKTLIFIDACYFKNGNHYMPGDSDWTDTFYPHIRELKKQLADADGDVYIFMHQNMDPGIPEDHRLFNAEQINALLQKSEKVKTVYQGHFHPGYQSMHNGIQYVTFPAMCENEHAYFIAEI